MTTSFSELMAELAKQVSMTKLLVNGEEFNRVATFTPDLDGKERILYWRGVDPDTSEFSVILRELKEYLSLCSG